MIMIQPDTTTKKPSQVQITTLYGTVTINEPILIDLLYAPTMKRLEHINQYGITPFIQKMPPYTRYAHSVGVMVLLRLFGAPLDEQIAGLLHDVSHTVFSHVGDFLYTATDDDSYQDSIHKWFIEQTELKNILSTHGYTTEDIIHKKDTFKLLEQDIPELCADRLEYVLYGGALKNILTKEDVSYILSHLKTQDQQWYFECPQAARLFATCALQLTKNEFASASGLLTYKWTAQALQRACEINVVSEHEIHFSVDEEVWQKLCNCSDEQIKKHIKNLQNYKKIITLNNENDYDIHMKGKFRGINPFVQYNNKLQRLTACDHDFKKEYECVHAQVKRGCFIKLRLG